MSQQLTPDRHRRFQDLLARRAGLHYPSSRHDDLAHGLDRALQATGLPGLDALYAAAHDDPGVWEEIIAQLTVGETYFFRHAAQFEVLRQQIIPELIAKRAQTRMLRIWSAGCATGEEPYSLAMLLHALLPDPESWHMTILATDINPRFLSRARTGLYGAWSFREDAATWRDRYFTPEQGRWRLRPEIRRMVTFTPLNLVESSYPTLATGTSAMDLIVCRNVTIYFDEATTRQIVERFYRALLPGGWLLVGHAEPHATNYQQFQVHNFPGAILYRKAPDAPGFAAAPADRPPAAIEERPAPSPKARAPHPQRAAAPLPRPLAKSAPSVERPAPAQTSAIWDDLEQALRANDEAAIERLQGALPKGGAGAEAAALRFAGMAAAYRRWAAADQGCAQALTHNPLSVQAHLLHAQIQQHQSQLDAALESYRRVLYLDPAVTMAMIGIAEVWGTLGRDREAARSWRSAAQQLAAMPAHTPIPGADGMTAGDLLRLVQEQIRRGAPSAGQIATTSLREGRAQR